MKRTMFVLFAAALVTVTQAVAAGSSSSTSSSGSQASKDSEGKRSVGAYPVAYDDYPEADVVLDVGPGIVLTVTGEARTRFEWVENASDFSSNGRPGPGDDFAFDDNYSFGASRFNLGVRADLPRNVAAVIDLQGNFELGGGPAGFGTEIRAQQTQHLRPGVLNRQILGPAFTRVGGAGGDIPAGGPFGGFAGSDGIPTDPRTIEVVRVLQDIAGDNVNVYQGYMEAAHIGDSILSVRVGRQELAFGTEFLLGNQDWYDGQTFDGVRGILEFSDNSRLDIFWAKLAERDTTVPSAVGDPALGQSGDDSDLYGVYFTTKSLGGSSVGMDAYALGLRDQANLAWNLAAFDAGTGYVAASGGYGIEADRSFLDAYWLGLRFFRDREHGFHFSAEVTYLFGNVEANLDSTGDGIADRSDLNIGAWATEDYLGFTWNHRTNPTIKGGLTYASGSSYSDYNGGDYRTFFTPAGEIHPRLGLADIVDASNVLAFNLGYSGSVDRHSWGVDLWDFNFDTVDPTVQSAFLDTTDPDNGKLGTELGQELDLWYNYQYSQHMVAQFALSYFNAGDFIEDTNRRADGSGDVHDPADTGGTSIRTDDAWRLYANLLVRF